MGGLGNFQIIKSLGQGATAEVHEAKNLVTGEFCALKVFNSIVRNDGDSMRRLEAEVSALRRLKHPNIVTLLSEVRDAQVYALELELVRGTHLKEWLEQYKVCLIEPLLWVLAQIARGLGAAHEKEILHRDLKPENILISESGDIKITDFGLARQLDRLTVTRLGLLMGSLGYMAPEVINGEKATARSDIFSFGVIAYEALTKKFPFSGETPQALLRSVVERPVVALRDRNPMVPLRIAAIIEKCLEKKPGDRPESIWNVEAEILNELASGRLLTLAAQMVPAAPREKLYREALTVKFESLKNRIEKFKTQVRENRSPTAKRFLVAAVSEFSALFPDDSSMQDALVGLSARQTPLKKNTVGAMAVVLIILLIVGGVRFFGFSRASLVAPPVETPKLVEAPVSAALPAAQPAARAATQDEKKPRLRGLSLRAKNDLKGMLHFEADNDVTIYVDGVPVPRDAWAAYKTTPGHKKIKLVKEGYLPIENEVVVSTGQPTVINAKSSQP